MTTNTIPILGVTKRLGRDNWRPPVEYGPSGWVIDNYNDELRIIITDAPLPPEVDPSQEWWRHASISHTDRIPTYDELQMLHRAVWPEGYAYQVFAAPADHININEHVLHLWGRPDGRRVLPDFGVRGTI